MNSIVIRMTWNCIRYAATAKNAIRRDVVANFATVFVMSITTEKFATTVEGNFIKDNHVHPLPKH